MRCPKHTFLRLATLFCVVIPLTHTATVQDVFNLNTRVPRDNKYYTGRYATSTLTRTLKPEDSPEARESTQNPVEKRCTRCDSTYSDSRNPYDNRARYEDRRYRPSYDDDRRYDRYDRYEDRRYDRYDDRDRYYDRYDRRPSYDRYDRDRYDRDRSSYDRYDNRDRYYERDYDRGFGYDNRGYDYRDRGYGGDQDFRWGGGYYSGRPDSGSGYWGTGGYASNWNYGGGGGGGRDSYGAGGGRDDGRDRDRYDYDGFRPWDETYRGISGWDSQGRGFYFASGIPEVGAEHWGTGGRYGGYNRPRDPYDGYRSTSYLYGRPASTTTDRPSSSDDPGVTQSPQDNPSG